MNGGPLSSVMPYQTAVTIFQRNNQRNCDESEGCIHGTLRIESFRSNVRPRHLYPPSAIDA